MAVAGARFQGCPLGTAYLLGFGILPAAEIGQPPRRGHRGYPEWGFRWDQARSLHSRV